MSERSLQDFAHGSSFAEPSVITAYRYRPSYPKGVFDLLLSLIPADAPHRALDIGCGTGLVARPLAALLDHIDAVDISAGMIDEGKRAPGGDRANLNWIVSPTETAPLDPPYGLATAGDSIGWMDWAVVLPKLADVLAPDAMFAMLNARTATPPWRTELLALIQRYSTNQNFKILDISGELEQRGVFIPVGRKTITGDLFVQSVDDYVESFHGRAAFARERMSREDARAFDDAVRSLLRSIDEVSLPLEADLAWGRPKHP